MSKIPICVITIDDAIYSDYTLAYKELRKRGMWGTSYVIGQRPPSGDKFYASWSLLRAMKKNGWDVECHTFYHSDLSTLTPEQIADQMQRNNNAFTANNLPTPIHLACPYGGYNSSTKDTVLVYRETMRTTIDDWNTYEQIKTRVFNGIHADIQDETQFQSVKSKVDAAYNNKGVAILYLHQVIVPGETGTYAITLAYLQQLLDYLIQKKIRVMKLTDMYAHVLAN